MNNIDLLKSVFRYVATQNIALEVTPSQEMNGVPSMNIALQYDMDATIDTINTQ